MFQVAATRVLESKPGEGDIHMEGCTGMGGSEPRQGKGNMVVSLPGGRSQCPSKVRKTSIQVEEWCQKGRLII